MGRSHRSRASADPGPRRRVLAAAAALALFGGLVGVTQISNAETEGSAPACEPTSPPASTGTPERDGANGDGDATGDDVAANDASPAATADATVPPASDVECDGPDGREPTAGASGGSTPGGGLDGLGDNCDNSRLPAHTGFQDGGRCVSTAFGEVGAAAQNPTLLITEAPRTVRAGQPFRIVVSTRNLVRDRFLPAAQGGYYLETSLLNNDGLVRGHFHTACRMLGSTTEAVDPAPVPAFFVATEDGKGGDEPDLVIVSVPGLPAGLAQCAAWAGDGSHRIPMMQRANQIPALDSVRIQVQPGEDEEPPADEPGDEQPPTDTPGDEEPPAGNPGGEQPPADQPGDESPGQQPDQEQPGNGQESDEQQPGRDEPGDETAPAPVATEPAPDGSAADDKNIAESPPARDTGTGGSGGGLALTGTNTIAFLVVGVALFIAGAALIYLTRRRRTARR